MRRQKNASTGYLFPSVLEKNASTGYLFPSVLVRGNFALMTRLARMVVSGLPHHVTQRGNRREPIFFEDGDQEIYRDLLGEQARKADVEVWAYCLMPNHVHLILNPRLPDGLGRAVGEAHRRYTNSSMHVAADGAPVPEPFRIGGHGRIASDFGSLLCQPESCPGGWWHGPRTGPGQVSEHL